MTMNRSLPILFACAALSLSWPLQAAQDSKVLHGVERGADATGRGIDRGAKATQRGVDHASESASRPIRNFGNTIGRKLNLGAPTKPAVGPQGSTP
jgi:hypothetical protein